MNNCKITRYTKHAQFLLGVSYIVTGIIGLVFLLIAEIFWGY